jgi:glycosyltransferase involved in cell wall biosynthesis
MFNEEAALPYFLEQMRPVLDALAADRPGFQYELVCVDDGSRDHTATLLLAARHSWPELRLVRLLRNAGHQAALTAGLTSARGDYVVTIDADLQDPPTLIAAMLATAESSGADVVYGVRSDRSTDSAFKRLSASAYYRMMRRVAGPQLPDNAGDFRLVSRRVVDALSALPEHGRVYRLVIPWFGFPSEEVAYARERRVAGQTKYPLAKMVSLAFDSLTSFTAAPLRFATWAGILGTMVAVFAGAWSVAGWVTGQTVPGWASILATVGFVGAVQLICLGLLGEYVARLFVASQQRPTYLVGFDSLVATGSAADHAPSTPVGRNLSDPRVPVAPAPAVPVAPVALAP